MLKKLVAALLAIGVVACGGAVAQSAYSLKTDPVSVADVKSVHVDSSVADVKFAKSNDGTSWAELVSEQSLEQNSLTSAVSDDGETLTYTLVYVQPIGIAVNTKNRTLTIYLPAQAYDELVLKVGVGNVWLSGFGATFGTISMDVGVGNVVFDNGGMVVSTLSLTVGTGNADAKIEKLGFGCDINVGVGNAGVSFGDMVDSADIHVETGVGDMHTPATWPGKPSRSFIGGSYDGKIGDALYSLNVKTGVGNVAITEK